MNGLPLTSLIRQISDPNTKASFQFPSLQPLTVFLSQELPS